MLIPKSIAKSIVNFAAREKTRYAINGVLFARNGGGKPIAVATDGRRLMTVSWTEDPTAEFPPIQGCNPTATDEFSAILPCSDLTAAAKSINGAAKRKPILGNIALQEDKRETDTPRALSLATTNLESNKRFGPFEIDGHFPKYQDVIPRNYVRAAGDRDRLLHSLRKLLSAKQFGLEAATLDEARAALADADNFNTETDRKADSEDCAIIGVNPYCLAELATAMGDMGNDTNHGIRLVVPLNPNKPILMTGKGPGEREITSVLMPMNLS